MDSSTSSSSTRYRRTTNTTGSGFQSSFMDSTSSFSSNFEDFELPGAYRRGRSDESSSSKTRRKGNNQKLHPHHQLREPSVLVLLGVVLFTLVVFGFVRYVDLFNLPDPLGLGDIADNPGAFIEERARGDLILLTSVGPRVAGSEANDVTTVESLRRIVEEIQRTKGHLHEVEFDVQKPKGSFHMWFQDGMTSSYSGIPNFIVKLSPKDNPKVNSSILVNCHFDSVPGSPGASDDMISCAVMLETLRVLSRSQEPLRNSIVFLFNGAEENILQGSHGFLRGKDGQGEASSSVGHKWATGLKCFVNLEAAGAGSREILFQTGPGNPWLVEAFKKVPYPWGSVVGEEIFQRGLIPSDTDFRIFRDFGHIPGLDFAFIKNGYVYHTKFDNVEHITPGTIQHEGSNVLVLLEHLGNLDFSEVELSDTRKMVFFDVFGFFVLAYSENSAIIMNVVLSLIVLVLGFREVDWSIKTLSWQVFSTILAWIAGILASLSIGLALNLLQIYSPYHSYPMSVFLLFGIPCVLGQVGVFSFLLKGEEDFCWIAGKVTLALLLLVGTFVTRIVFNLTFNLFFGMLAWFVARELFRGYKLRLFFYLILGEAFPLAFSLYLVAGCLDLFVPIMGRSGTEANPNLFLAVLTSITITLPTFSGIVPIFLFFKKSFIKLCTASMILLIIVMLLVVGRIPYQEKTPMRFHLIEVDRTIFSPNDLTTVKKHDSGFWLFNVDPNIPMFYDILGEDIPELKHKNHVEIDALACSEELHCGLPFIYPVKKLIRNTHWIPKTQGLPESLTSRDKIRMEVLSDAMISSDVRRLSLSFVGPDHLTVYLSPGKNYDLVSWSLTEKPPTPMTLRWKDDRPTYFVYHGRGITFERFNVILDFKKKKNQEEEEASKEDPLVDINFSSFYLHGDGMKSKEMLDFIRKLPSWTYVLGFTGVSHVYSIPAN